MNAVEGAIGGRSESELITSGVPRSKRTFLKSRRDCNINMLLAFSHRGGCQSAGLIRIRCSCACDIEEIRLIVPRILRRCFAVVVRDRD